MFGYHLLCIVTLFALGISQILGPADYRVKSIVPCPDKGPYQSWFGMTFRKHNRTTQVFDLNITFHIWIDDQVGIYVKHEKLVDGGYKTSYEMRDNNFCEFAMKYMYRPFSTILRHIGLEEKCPIPPGSYSRRDYIFDFEQMNPTTYGSFVLQPEGVKDGKSIFCFRVYYDSTPKKLTQYIG